MLLQLSAVLLPTLCVALAPKGPWDAFNYAPASKIVKPVSIRSVSGDVSGAEGLVESSAAQVTFTGDGSFVVLDWGIEVGGLLSLTIDKATPSSQFSLSFTESPQFISPDRSDDSCYMGHRMDTDGVQSFRAPLQPGLLTQTLRQQRGGFRFLTIVSNAAEPLSISNITLEITFMPHWDDLRAYPGYFYAIDPLFYDADFLTKLWYAGAYTVQTNTIDANQARQQPCPDGGGWENDASGGSVEGPILVDGAKRDRCDCGISTHTEFVALNDMLPTKNALAVMFSMQDPDTGALAYAGPPINAHGSATYIAWSLIGTHSYFLYTGDLAFVQTVWPNYTQALGFLERLVDATGLADVPVEFQNDWGRNGGAGHNSAFNALLYRVLTASELASHLGDEALSTAYLANSTRIKAAYNKRLWNAKKGLFRDNDLPGSIHPQDGNSLAVLFNLTRSHKQNKAISKGLTRYWTSIGPLCPELGGHHHSDLMRSEWGYMLYTNLSVQSTLLEGFTANGSLGYRAAAGYEYDHSYTSTAHGWSSGQAYKASQWAIAPVLSGLNAAEGGLETGLGFFGVKWEVNYGEDTLTLTLQTPAGTRGTVTLPGVGPLSVDGRRQPKSGGGSVKLAGGTYTVSRRIADEVEGSAHNAAQDNWRIEL
ncbi:glycoside hydrolase family 78 protein [Mycena rebaudengoi]|nr:glycoside hydrolase family 78 protein [Mycena rebaudengoi]